MNLKVEKTEAIEETLPVPLSSTLKNKINILKKVCGKAVNAKIREYLEQLAEENKDIIKSAS